MTRACAGNVATAFTMREDPGPLLSRLGGPGRALGERLPFLFLRRRHVLLKLVFANLNLTWLSANFPEARQLVVLRHPCGQFASWRRLGWATAWTTSRASFRVGSSSAWRSPGRS